MGDEEMEPNERDERIAAEDKKRNVVFHAQHPSYRCADEVGCDKRAIWMQLGRKRLPESSDRSQLAAFLTQAIAKKEVQALKGEAAVIKAKELLADGEKMWDVLNKPGFEALYARLRPLRTVNLDQEKDEKTKAELVKTAETLCAVAGDPSLQCANGLLATGNPISVAMTAANNVSNPLGVGQGGNAAEGYVAKYAAKEDTKVNRSLSAAEGYVAKYAAKEDTKMNRSLSGGEMLN